MENLKKSVENKNKLRTIYPNNKEDFKNNKPHSPISLVLIKQRGYASLSNCFKFSDKMDPSIRLKNFNNSKNLHAICLKIEDLLFTSVTKFNV